ncbi:hypothetical protein BJ138DRAFT_1139170 [Hygrophoropsis aurantiaca]|uniref:Uncharacterized protein n=1 Tax=Hygrophoropsis aurantiaca TaxID=72124 RepID=A0ACB8AUU5_9AGAM|nr:hypothetical protein BJ138DRAFT_1139170 [Hygrophoropsis aurantiaca]
MYVIARLYLCLDMPNRNAPVCMFFPLLLRHSARSLPKSHHYSTSSITSSHSIFLSKSTDPYFNLTFEDWLFRHKAPNDPLLLIYRDSPCVIIGRNQNPWKEVNLAASRQARIPFIRRRSGGGTVYHDLGNTNFSIHVPRTTFDRRATAQIILRAVRELGIDANVNERNDICVGKEKMSCSAYKIVNNRAYHHGTMLISTRLDALGNLLRSNKETMVTKGVASVRSPVCNLRQFSPNISHDTFVDAVVREFQKEYGVTDKACEVNDSDDITNIDYIRTGMAELPSWDWAYGQTPEFEYGIRRSFLWGEIQVEIHSRHGVVTACQFEILKGRDTVLSEALRHLGKALEGKRYAFTEEIEGVNEERCLETWEWLKSQMDS